MIVSGGHLLGIDHVETDGISILGDGVKRPLEVNPDLLDFYSAGPGIALNEMGENVEIENTDHIFYEEPEYIVSGDSMSAYLNNNRYSKFSVPEEVKKLTIKVAGTDDESTVSKTMFEFLKEGEESAKLESVHVLGEDETECLMNAPMNWPGTATYHGVVLNNIATILGYTSGNEVDEAGRLITDSGQYLVTDNGDYLTFEIDPTSIDDNERNFILFNARYRSGRWIPDRTFNELVNSMNGDVIPLLRVKRAGEPDEYYNLYKYKPNDSFVFRAPVRFDTIDSQRNIITPEFTYKLRSFSDTTSYEPLTGVDIYEGPIDD